MSKLEINGRMAKRNYKSLYIYIYLYTWVYIKQLCLKIKNKIIRHSKKPFGAGKSNTTDHNKDWGSQNPFLVEKKQKTLHIITVKNAPKKVFVSLLNSAIKRHLEECLRQDANHRWLKYWKVHNPKQKPSCAKHGGGNVMVWAWMAASGTELCFLMTGVLIEVAICILRSKGKYSLLHNADE